MTEKPKGHKPEKSIVSEAWQRMSDDMDKFLPQKMHGGRGKVKFTLGLAIIELLLLGAVGMFIYDWLQG